MNIYLNSVTGIDDAIVSMFMSKRTWTRTLEEDIRSTCSKVFSKEGMLIVSPAHEDYEKIGKWMNSLVKWGWTHITMLRFIDLSVTVEGLHRAGQDDWDSHSQRFNNRIIRSSTRLADFTQEEQLSDFYKGKVIPTDIVLKTLEVDLPEEIEIDNKVYVKSVNGYILKKEKDNKDVKRGLYMLGIPSNFIFKVNLTEFAHVYKERGIHSGANPEVKEVAEKIADAIEDFIPWFNRELFMKIKN